MPILLLLAIIVILGIAALGISSDTDCEGLGCLLWLVNIGLGIWLFLACCQSRTYDLSKSKIMSSVTVEDIDIIVVDNKPINLNERFDRRFQSGSQIEVKYPQQCYYGISFFLDDNKYEIIPID